MLGARVDSMSDRLCHCRARSSAAMRDESDDEVIPDRMASPISEGSYHTPVRAVEEIPEVVRETSEETFVNPTSSSPELEYEGENQVAIPIPPPSISPVRGQRASRSRRWGPYSGRRRPVRGMQTSDPNVLFGSDFHGSAVVPGRDDASVSSRPGGAGSRRVRRRERLDCPYALVGPACRGRLELGDESERSDGGVVSGAESGSGSSLSRFSERPPSRRTSSGSRPSSGSGSGRRDGRRGNRRECLGGGGGNCFC
jgi:hypothetical protein